MAEEVRNNPPEVKNPPPDKEEEKDADAQQAPPQEPGERKPDPTLGHRRVERPDIRVKQANAAEQMRELSPQVWAATPQRGGGISYIVANEGGGFSSVFYDPRRGNIVTRDLGRRFNFERFVQANAGRVQLSANVRYNPQQRKFEFIGGQQQEEGNPPQQEAGGQAGGERPPEQGGQPPGEDRPPEQGGQPPGGGRPPEQAGNGGQAPIPPQDTVPPAEAGRQEPPPVPPQQGGVPGGGAAPPGAGGNTPLVVKIVPGTRINVQDDGKALVFE